MGRMYTVSFEAGSFTNANGDYDYFELTPAANKRLIVHGIFLSFYSEVGDTQEEIVRWGIVRGHATSGNGTATTPRPVNPTDPAAAFTAETVGATIASAGTGVNIHADAFNLRVGLVYIPTPEMRPQVTSTETTLVVRQFSTLADDANANGTIYVEEF